MPVPLRITRGQGEQIRALDGAITNVSEQGTLGAGPLVRVLWANCREAVVKMFDSPAIFENEVQALTQLRGSLFVPELFGFGTAATPFVLKNHLGKPVPYFHYWLCRSWIDDVPRPRLPISHPQLFAAQLGQFAAECTRARLLMGDGKIGNFLWDGRSMVWLDFGWFYAAGENATVHNSNFCAHLLDTLGW